jgi:tRNA(Ile)-lysidine synthase
LILVEKSLIEEKQFSFDPNNLDLNLPINLKCEFRVYSNSQIWHSHQAALDKKLVKKLLFLRKYKKGDYFYPIGMKGKKLLSKFFKDEKYSLLEKEKQWLLCSDDQIIWVIGRRCDRRYVANNNTETTLLISVI